MSALDRTPEIVVARAIIRDGYSRLLTLRRAESDSHAPGRFEFPGGKIDAEETITQGLRREIKEETNLDIRLDPNYTFFHSHKELLTAEASSKYPGHIYSVLFRSASILRESEGLAISEKHIEAKWVSPLDLLDNDSLMIESKNALRAYIQTLRSL